MKKYFLLIFSFFAIFLFVFAVFKNKHFEPISIKDLLIHIQNYKLYVNENKLLFVTIYFFFSILWICLSGIMTPMLLLSTFMFEYLAFILSTISFSIGSTLSYLFAKKFKNYIDKNFRKVTIKNNSFFLFIIFRFIPGVPYILKNISGIFFKLQNREFFIATIIADTPQIFLIVFLIKRSLDASDDFINDFDITLVSGQLFLPIFLIFLFLILVFVLKKKFNVNFYKK